MAFTSADGRFLGHIWEFLGKLGIKIHDDLPHNVADLHKTVISSVLATKVTRTELLEAILPTIDELWQARANAIDMWTTERIKRTDLEAQLAATQEAVDAKQRQIKDLLHVVEFYQRMQTSIVVHNADLLREAMRHAQGALTATGLVVPGDVSLSELLEVAEWVIQHPAEAGQS